MDNKENIALIQTIDDDLEKMIELLISWASINSGSENLSGLERMKDALIEAFSPLSDKTEILPLQPTLGKALLFTKNQRAPLQLFLSLHMDTVFSASHPFQEVVQVDAHKLKGPGVADMKGGAVVLLKTLQTIEKKFSIKEDRLQTLH